jgi:hypothetical protein
MRLAVLALGGVLVMVVALAAQTSTADGVDAFVRGDYARAAQILKPIAESWPPGDPTAAFFLATLYENGLGVPADPLRACALYVRALNPENPFSRSADVLAQVFFQTSQSAIQDCPQLAILGFEHGFQPVTFTLESGHWITLDVRGGTITFEGKDKRFDHGLATGGVRFLPVEHTELAVGPARSTRRHFIEFFAWRPGQKPLTWTLFWHVFEVVRNDLVGIITERLVTVAGERPPTAPVDVRAMARLRVNEKGDAEWAVLTEQTQRSEVIETEAERLEVREQASARKAAEARVDWQRVRDAHRAPTLIYADAEGCANIFVYGRSDDRTEAITIRADKDALGLSTAPRMFDLASLHSNLEVLVRVYQRPVRRPFCTDSGGSEGPPETWRATRGTVTIELSPPGVRAGLPAAYRATIRIVGAEFVSASGVRVKQVQPITLTAIVGLVYG